MKVISLSCDRCGAKLDVPSKANYVTCTFCQTRLKVQRGETAVVTEALEKLSSEIHSLKRDASVARLDREWEASRERFQTRRKGEETQSLPSTAGGVVAIVIGVAWAWALMGGLSQTMGAPINDGFHLSRGSETSFSPFAIVGLLGGIAFVGAGLSQISRASTYKAELAKYRESRRDLMGD